MSIFARSRPQGLADLVFASSAVRDEIYSLANPALAKNLLLYGESGSGKSVTCDVLARHLVGSGHTTDIKTINVSKDSSKGVLISTLTNFNGMSGFNNLGKVIFILEELDGADATAQLALKVELEEQESSALFFATTNNPSRIIAELQDRFTSIHLPRPDEQAWAGRAKTILDAENVLVTTGLAANVLKKFSKSNSSREYLRAIDRYADDVRRANTPKRGT